MVPPEELENTLSPLFSDREKLEEPARRCLAAGGVDLGGAEFDPNCKCLAVGGAEERNEVEEGALGN